MGSKQETTSGVLQGTLDMLVLKALVRGPLHGYDVAEYILARSGDVLRVEEGALYPALHRLELRGWIEGEWGVSTNNRRAKFYKLTAAGRRQLAVESTNWARMSGAVGRVMEAS
ncbi:MAG TPA: PadR family transcriptional regulator [Paludibaculum sp.]|jgi:transcriptional regulator